MKGSAIVTAALIAASSGACAEKLPADEIRMSGTVEVDPVKIMPLIGGRLIEVGLEEGAKLEEGQVVASIDCAELELQLQQAEAGVKGANARLQLIEKGARKEDIRWMRQVIKGAKISKSKIETDLALYDPLVKSGAMPKKQFDDLQVAGELADAKLAEAQQQYVKMIKGAQPEEIEAALSAVEQAEAMVGVIEKKLTYCEVLAPTSGTVMHKLAEPGEAAAPGLPIGVIADLTRVKVKGYVSEKDLGHVKLGGPASVYIDSYPGKPIRGTITSIADEAEFTPKNIQTQDERVKTVYEVKVGVDNADGRLKSGMPADIVIKK